MKKLFIVALMIVLIASLTTACNPFDRLGSVVEDIGGGIFSGAAGDGGDGSSKAPRDVIKASDLISIEEAEAIFDQSMKEKDPGEMQFADSSRYRGEDLTYAMELWQEALYDEGDVKQKLEMKNGWDAYLEKERQKFVDMIGDKNARYDIVEVNGIGDHAYLQQGLAFEQWLLYVFYDEYCYNVVIGNNKQDRVDTEEDTVWKQAKLKEAANLALDHLKAIIG